MRHIFCAPRKPRPWYRWVIFPVLLAGWVWREMREGVNELWDERVGGGYV
jgi:hypothetical protein